MPFDGFDIPDELADMAAVAERFVTERLVPAERDLAIGETSFTPDVLASLRTEARRIGLWCLDAPAEYGGAGLSSFDLVVVLEAAAKHRLCFPHAGGGAFGYSPPVILYRFGSDALIDRYVRPAIDEGWASFTAIAEESGGSDPARAIKLAARRDGDSYVLSGSKQWITNVESASYGVVFARTDAGVSAFVVEPGTPGLSWIPLPVLRDKWPSELVFNDVRIPAENLIGTEGEGLKLAGTWLNRGRLVIAARSLGVATEALRMAVDWMKTRNTFGAPLATRQGLQWQVADARIELDAARMLLWRAAWLDDQGRSAATETAMAKLACTEVAYRILDRAMQLMGAQGMSRELPLEKWFRDVRVTRLYEGSTEILRTQVARRILGN